MITARRYSSGRARRIRQVFVAAARAAASAGPGIASVFGYGRTYGLGYGLGTGRNGYGVNYGTEYGVI